MAEAGRANAPLGEGDVRAVLDEPERLTLVAQPIVDLVRVVVVGYETLSRFSIGRPAPPDHVFAAGAQAGLGQDLESLVLRRALELAARRPANCFLTVNVEPAHLHTQKVREAIDTQSRLDGIVFELTEHRSIEDVAGVRRALQELRERGAMSALDDAGAGHSGLKRILELQPQFLKVDRDLVTAVHEDEAKRAVIQMLGDLAGRLDAWLLAEGIETEEELRSLGQLGVPLGQGYFLARPAPPWCGLAEGAAAAFGRRETRGSEATVADLVEPCAVCDEAAPWPPEGRSCVRLDADARPVGMRWCNGADDAQGVVRRDHELLRVKRGSPLSDVALRAATRPAPLRWDPLVCIDESGRFKGIVPMQRVVCSLAVGAKTAGASIQPRSFSYDGEPVRH